MAIKTKNYDARAKTIREDISPWTFATKTPQFREDPRSLNLKGRMNTQKNLMEGSDITSACLQTLWHSGKEIYDPISQVMDEEWSRRRETIYGERYTRLK